MIALRQYALPAVAVCFGLVSGLALDGSALKSFVADSVVNGTVIASRSPLASDLGKPAAPSLEQIAQQLSVEPNLIKPTHFAWVLGGAFFLIWLLLRSSKILPVRDVKRPNFSSVKGSTVSRITVQKSAEAPIDVPRNLIEKPFSPEIKGVDFEARVQCAIMGSLRHSRVLGVIHLGFHTGEDCGSASNPKLMNIRMGAIQKELEAKLRSGDCVKITGEGEISVIIPLLACKADLERIADRLCVVAIKAGPELDLSVAYQPGCAMYPIDGYSAAELIDAARGRARSAACLGAAKKKELAQLETANVKVHDHSSVMKDEEVYTRQANPRISVIHYPRIFDEGLPRRLVLVNNQHAAAKSLTQPLQEPASSTSPAPL